MAEQMSDRYLCKAKRTDNGEWVEGYPIIDECGYFIMPEDYISERQLKNKNYGYELILIKAFDVDPETLCQYTGLTDKNGKNIWENDIVEFEDTGEEGYEYKEGFDFKNRARVVFEEGRWQFTDFLSDNSGVLEEMYQHDEFMGIWEYVEVIGNIFDNPELLEGVAE